MNKGLQATEICKAELQRNLIVGIATTAAEKKKSMLFVIEFMWKKCHVSRLSPGIGQ